MEINKGVQQFHFLCKVKSWPTDNGFMCQFPFTHNGQLYYDCAPKDHDHTNEWCAYSTNEDMSMKKWEEY